MEIEYIYGPKCGQHDHMKPEDALPLIKAGFASEVIPAPKPASAPRFGIHRTMGGIVSIQYECDTCHRRMNFGGGILTKNDIDCSLCSHALANGGVPEAAIQMYNRDSGIKAHVTGGMNMTQPDAYRLVPNPRTGEVDRVGCGSDYKPEQMPANEIQKALATLSGVHVA